MFLKPLKIRSQNQLKTSEKKRLIEELHKHFPALGNDLDICCSKKGDILLLKVETGSKLLIPVYVVNDKPIAFVYNQTLIPTLHLLCKYPKSILIFKTHGEVLKKMVGGADLMLPGVIAPTASNMPLFSKDSPACVALSNRLIPVAVGVTADNSSNLAASTKGKCVHTLHVIGDKLYNLKNMSSNIHSPLEELVLLLRKVERNDPILEQENEIMETMSNLDLGSVDAATGHDESDSPLAGAECLTNEVGEMDKLLMNTLFVVMKYSKSLKVPILTSSFFKTHMVPASPPNKSLDVKKSSFKKCGNFMQYVMQMPSSQEECKVIEKGFATTWNFPCCCGAL